MKLIIILIAIFCMELHAIPFLSANKEKVERILRAEGCTDLVVGGWNWLAGCDTDDAFTNVFTCKKNGQEVSGVVCSGWFKGFTVRYQ